MILPMAPIMAKLEIVKVKEKTNDPSVHRHLVNLGFVEGADIKVVSETNGNLIVLVKDSRVAIGKDLAKQIQVKIKGDE